MAIEVDLIVVGTGAAAQSVAFPCREAGWSVLVIDSRPFGGTCQLRGCDPKKVLVGVSEVVDWAGRMKGKGVDAAPELAWPEMAAFKRTFVDGVPEAMAESFQNAGIQTVQGRAHFVGPHTVKVADDEYTARHVVIAAGARHAPLAIPGEEHLITSSGFLDLQQLPERVVFVGGGYIAFEFAHIAARAGAAVTVLHRGDRPLEGFDQDLVSDLVALTRELGVDVRVGTTVTGLEKRDEELVVHAGHDGQPLELPADLVIHAAGRVPEIDDLRLQAAGIAREEHGGVLVNQYLQSVSNPAVYAAGDAAESGRLPLTPVAGMQGRVVAANLLGGQSSSPNYLGIPTVVFTTPPLARVGLDEHAATEQGLAFTVKHETTTGWYSSRRVALARSAFKTLVEDGTGRLLGAHILGVHAEETINIFALAIRHGLTTNDLKHMVFAYPTSASDISYML
jgi:glutathione reductase (NADPH)